MIKSYHEFLNESILNVNLGVVSILNKINHRLAKSLLNLVGKDINTQFNGIDLTDEAEYVSFMTDKQFQSKLDQNYSPYELFSPRNNSGRIGKIFASILRDNSIRFTQSELDTFIIEFKSENMNRLKIPLRIVRGQEIRKWFSENNFTKDVLEKGDIYLAPLDVRQRQDQPQGRGFAFLGRNCMRYDKCQDFLDMYVDNPEVVGMLIYTRYESGVEKLRSRALIWETNLGTYLDRVYSSTPSEGTYLQKWAKKNLNITNSYSDERVPRMMVQLKEPGKKYFYYPYLDSLPYYDVIAGKLTNYEPLVKSNNPYDLLFLQQDDGSTLPSWGVWSDYLNSPIEREKAFWSDEEQSWLPKDIETWEDY